VIGTVSEASLIGRGATIGFRGVWSVRSHTGDRSRREQLKRLLIAPALAVLLSGCVVGGESARHDLEASKAAYKACLAAQKPEACEGPRRAYEADLSAYRATPKIVIGAGGPPPRGADFLSDGLSAGDPAGGPVHTTRLLRKSSIMISTDIPPGAVKQISVGERHPPQPPRFRSATPD
jgi:hypothetical protein